MGGHRDGHVSFDIEITDAIVGHGQHRLTLRIYDSAYDLTQPKGETVLGGEA